MQAKLLDFTVLRPFVVSSLCRFAANEPVSLHAPSQQIEAVLSEERLAVEDHQRHAPMAGALLRGFIFGDRSFIAVRLALDFRIEFREVEPRAPRRARDMVA